MVRFEHSVSDSQCTTSFYSACYTLLVCVITFLSYSCLLWATCGEITRLNYTSIEVPSVKKVRARASALNRLVRNLPLTQKGEKNGQRAMYVTRLKIKSYFLDSVRVLSYEEVGC